jgi:hypothetical protein
VVGRPHFSVRRWEQESFSAGSILPRMLEAWVTEETPFSTIQDGVPKARDMDPQGKPLCRPNLASCKGLNYFYYEKRGNALISHGFLGLSVSWNFLLFAYFRRSKSRLDRE